MATVLLADLETTFQVVGGDKDPSPYDPLNHIVSAGWATVESTMPPGTPLADIVLNVDWSTLSPVHYVCFKHSTEPEGDTKAFRDIVAKADVFVAHNAKFDLSWCIETNMCKRKDVFCTMIAEFIAARGVKLGMSLSASLERNKIPAKKSTAVREYMDKNISFHDIPWPIIEEYGRADVEALIGLLKYQVDYYKKHASLVPTLQMMNEMCYTLTRMEGNGIAIDVEKLDSIRKEFSDELDTIKKNLYEIANKVMGDRPYNLDSPEQLSQVIYSRKVKDKKSWASVFNIGMELRGAVKKPKQRTRMNGATFAHAVREGTEYVYRTRGKQCNVCGGRGFSFKAKKDGSNYTKSSRCTWCTGCGIEYAATGKIAGLKLSPSGPYDAAAGGFNTDKETLSTLIGSAQSDEARAFLIGITRANALSTYITSFVDGIRRAIKSGTTVHTTFNQCVASTGRLSSSNPNQQNLPRGNTFPVKRAIVSRWAGRGGLILEADAAQLEFRCAAFQAGDTRAIHEIKSGVDVHEFTRDTITAAGQTIDRQVAKGHTFKPLYGGTSGTEAEQAYYKAFTEKYKGIADWHRKLSEEAIKTKKIVIPSGREYSFAEAARTRSGWTSFATQVKNYPVQGFATGDVIPITTITIQNRLDASPQYKSLLINEVHDSNLLDIYPGEEAAMIELVSDAMLGVVDELLRRYGVKFNVPFEIEIKVGPSWGEGKFAKKASTTKYCD